MKVLHVHSGNLYGGVETMLVTLARHRELCADMEPHFAVCFDGRLSRELTAWRAAVYALGSVRVSRPHSVWRARRRLRELLGQRQFDVVICHSAWSQAIFGPTVRRAGTPLVFYLHGLAQTLHWSEKWARRTAPDFVVCNSRFTASKLPTLYPNIEHTVIYCALAPGRDDRFDRAAVRASLNTATDSIVILQVGRMEPLKGHLQLLEALATLAHIPNWVCWQVGGAQRRQEIHYMAMVKEKAAQLGVSGRVHFLGERGDVPGLMAAADVYCQPNISGESFGLTFLEALSAHLPVVTTGIGGAQEILTPHCGVLVRPLDTSALAAALEQLISDASLRERLGAAGPAQVRHLGDVSAQLDALRHALLRVAA